MTPQISVIIPSYNPSRALLERLYQSLCAQRLADFEAILVDDGSAHANYSGITDPRFSILRQPSNRGPAACRNAGAAAAQSPYLFFTDTDCELHPDALARAVHALPDADAIAGNTITRVQTRFGRAVALLGFPGGGILGFDKVWRVDPDGRAYSFSSCNLAMPRAVFEVMGRFDESFPVAGGEDTVLARRMVEADRRIQYLPEQIVYHVEKRGLRAFIRWQITRGRGNYHIRKHVGRVGGYLRLRLWTFKNSLQCAGPLYAPVVAALIALSVFFQTWGYYLEGRRNSRH